MTNVAYKQITQEDPASHRYMAVMQSLRPVPRITIHAFCESEVVAGPIERAAGDRRMSKAHVKIQTGGVETAISHYQTAPTPNLVILETRSGPKELLESLRQFAEYCDPTTKVIVIGHHNDVWLYRELMRSGVSEYVVAPVSMADIVSAVSSIFMDPEAKPIGRSIAFVGAKGGVGSSTIAHNVAWAMSTLFSSEVVVADLDLPFGTANINFDQDPAQGIAEAVFAPERVDEVYLDRLLARCAERLSLLAAPSTLDRVYDFDPDAFTHIIEVVQRNVPLLVLDVPHIWSGWVKDLLTQADEVVITATPELANLRNTKNLIDMLKKLRPNDAMPRLIVNQTGVPKRPEISPRDFAEPLGVTPIAVIPFDAQLFGNAANSGRMLGEMEKQSPVARTINEIANVLTGRSELKSRPKPGLDSLIGMLKLKKK